jgi:hypothetical protein
MDTPTTYVLRTAEEIMYIRRIHWSTPSTTYLVVFVSMFVGYAISGPRLATRVSSHYKLNAHATGSICPQPVCTRFWTEKGLDNVQHVYFGGCPTKYKVIIKLITQMEANSEDKSIKTN